MQRPCAPSNGGAKGEHPLYVPGHGHNIYERQGRHQQAADHYRQTAILSAELDDQSGEGRALANLGGIDCLQSRYEQAARHLHRALVLFREIGDRQGEAAALAGLGLVDGLQGRYGRRELPPGDLAGCPDR